jgi:hypothetical protein
MEPLSRLAREYTGGDAATIVSREYHEEKRLPSSYCRMSAIAQRRTLLASVGLLVYGRPFTTAG